MRHTSPFPVIVGGLAALFLAGCGPAQEAPGVREPPVAPTALDAPAEPAEPKADASEPARPREIEIDLDDALELVLPAKLPALEPVAFETPDGKSGWVVAIPGNRPIATPAYANGRLFVGGGYGSHEFYAFDAKTGGVVWQIKTGDDGPSAAVVEDGYVAFNTESCTVIVCHEKTGEIAWQEWLGDPLMSQPAISKGRLFIAYPAGQVAPQNRVETETGADATAKPPAQSHRLLCADLATGKHIWKRPISGDVMAAPVIDGGRVYLTCFDGTSFCLEEDDGAVVWKKEMSGTSAPLIAGGQVIVTQRATPLGGGTGPPGIEPAREGIARLTVARGEMMDGRLLREDAAEYLEAARSRVTGIGGAAEATLDAEVGFGSAPATAGLSDASKNVGVKSVVGGWAFQGSRAAVANDRIFNAAGRTLNSLEPRFGGAGGGGGARVGGGWRATIAGAVVEDGVQTFSPPALGRTHLYLTGGAGHIASVRQEDGEVGFLYATGRPMVFQPALAGGNLYAGTADGLLICIETGDPDVDDWSMWGGDAQHNKSR